MKLGSELTFQIDLAAAAIAFVALYFSIRAGVRQRRLERESLRLRRDSDIIAWSEACLSGFCQAEMLLRPEYVAVTDEKEFEKKRYEVLAEISCCIDRGRFFFQNTGAEKFEEKESAYRGFRPPMLDKLVGTYQVLSNATYQGSKDPSERAWLREQAIKHKRAFVSMVQTEVDPRRLKLFLQHHK